MSRFRQKGTGIFRKSSALEESESRQAFYEAFARLLEKKEAQKIAVRDLTEVSGYSRSTFYRLFADLPDSIDQLGESMIRIFIRRLRPVARFRPEESDDALFVTFLDLFHEYAVLLRFYSRDEKRAHLIQTIIRFLPEEFEGIPVRLPDPLAMEIYLSGDYSVLHDYLEHPKCHTDDELLSYFRCFLKRFSLRGIWKSSKYRSADR